MSLGDMAYVDRLRTAAAARDSLLCIGLDPDPAFIRGGIEGALDFCHALIDTTSDIACCYKPNAAFWEQYGPRGWEALASVRGFVPPDIPVLLDCKRADVPNTMTAYAAAVFDTMQFDAATVHAYHGADSLAAFTKVSGASLHGPERRRRGCETVLSSRLQENFYGASARHSAAKCTEMEIRWRARGQVH